MGKIRANVYGKPNRKTTWATLLPITQSILAADGYTIKLCTRCRATRLLKLKSTRCNSCLATLGKVKCRWCGDPMYGSKRRKPYCSKPCYTSAWFRRRREANVG